MTTTDAAPGPDEQGAEALEHSEQLINEAKDGAREALGDAPAAQDLDAPVHDEELDEADRSTLPPG